MRTWNEESSSILCIEEPLTLRHLWKVFNFFCLCPKLWCPLRVGRGIVVTTGIKPRSNIRSALVSAMYRRSSYQTYTSAHPIDTLVAGMRRGCGSPSWRRPPPYWRSTQGHRPSTRYPPTLALSTTFLSSIILCLGVVHDFGVVYQRVLFNTFVWSTISYSTMP